MGFGGYSTILMQLTENQHNQGVREAQKPADVVRTRPGCVCFILPTIPVGKGKGEPRNRRSQFVAAVTGGMAVTISRDGNSYAYVIQSRAFDGIGGGGNSLIACGLGL